MLNGSFVQAFTLADSLGLQHIVHASDHGSFVAFCLGLMLVMYSCLVPSTIVMKLH